MSTIVNGRWLLFLVSLSLFVCECHRSVFFSHFFSSFIIWFLIVLCSSLCVCAVHKIESDLFTFLESSSHHIELKQNHNLQFLLFHLRRRRPCMISMPSWCSICANSDRESCHWVEIAFKCKVNHSEMQRRWNRRRVEQSEQRLCELKNDNLIAEIYWFKIEITFCLLSCGRHTHTFKKREKMWF